MSGIDLVVLSPHLDDAVLSCGGEIADRTRAGERVVVVTAMAGPQPDELSPAAAELHRIWGLGPDVVALRRREDAAACRLLGADWRHWDIPEAIYAGDGEGLPLYPSIPSLFGSPHASDDRTLDLPDRIRALESSRVLAPTGIGGHVDHLAVRRAAEDAVARDRLVLYEELPYAETRRTAAEALDGWRSRTIPVSAEGARAKARAVIAYRSQIRGLFGGRIRARLAVHRSLSRRGGEGRRLPAPP